MKCFLTKSAKNLIKIIQKILRAVGSFKFSKLLILCLTFCSFLTILTILHGIYCGNLSFSQEQLRELAVFSINVSFTIAALGFTIFSLPNSPTFASKRETVLRFIGSLLSNISVSILAYIFSFSNPDHFISYLKISGSRHLSICEILFCASLLSLCVNVVFFLKIIMKCFHKDPGRDTSGQE